MPLSTMPENVTPNDVIEGSALPGTKQVFHTKKMLHDFMLNLPEGVELDLRVPGILWMLRQKGLLESA